jgi:hypothetical protein
MKTLVALIVALTCFVRCLSSELIVPSALPAYLPIGSERAMLDWAVTNRQWSLNGKPLRTETSWVINFKAGSVGVSSTNLKPLNSFEEFCDETDHIVRDLLIPALKQRQDINPEEELTLVVHHDYGDRVRKVGIPVLRVDKGLGRLSEMKIQSFIKGFEIIYLWVVVRVQNLERFEIAVSDPDYNFIWPSRSAKPAGTYGTELTTGEYLVLNPWYSHGDHRVRFKVTVGGETREYTQSGSTITAPSVRVIDDSSVGVRFSKGSDTIVESSTDLEHWSIIGEIDWNFGTDLKKFPVYPSDKGFFRARSY